MKKGLKSIFALLLIFSLITSLLSCGLLPDGGGEYVPEQNDPTVMVYCDSGATVDGESMATVKAGESVSFKINFDSTVLDSVEVVSGDGVALFDEESSTLTVKGATRNTAVNIYTTEISYDVTVELKYLFKGSKGDVSKPGSSSSILAGTLVTLTAGDNDRVFKGWSLGSTLSAGGELLSESRSYQLRLSPDMVKNGMITIYSNYTDANKLIYNANGGEISTAQTANLSGNDYYTAQRSGESLTVTYTKQYLEFFECGCSFWDDGSFKREGYILEQLPRTE